MMIRNKHSVMMMAFLLGVGLSGTAVGEGAFEQLKGYHGRVEGSAESTLPARWKWRQEWKMMLVVAYRRDGLPQLATKDLFAKLVVESRPKGFNRIVGQQFVRVERFSHRVRIERTALLGRSAQARGLRNRWELWPEPERRYLFDKKDISGLHLDLKADWEVSEMALMLVRVPGAQEANEEKLVERYTKLSGLIKKGFDAGIKQLAKQAARLGPEGQAVSVIAYIGQFIVGKFWEELDESVVSSALRNPPVVMIPAGRFWRDGAPVTDLTLPVSDRVFPERTDMEQQTRAYLWGQCWGQFTELRRDERAGVRDLVNGARVQQSTIRIGYDMHLKLLRVEHEVGEDIGGGPGDREEEAARVARDTRSGKRLDFRRNLSRRRAAILRPARIRRPVVRRPVVRRPIQRTSRTVSRRRPTVTRSLREGR